MFEREFALPPEQQDHLNRRSCLSILHGGALRPGQKVLDSAKKRHRRHPAHHR
jgi:hypothetical protein